MDYEFGEAIRLADTMSPRSVAVAVADMVRELGALPLTVLYAAMAAAGYDDRDQMAVAIMASEDAAVIWVGTDLLWVGGAA